MDWNSILHDLLVPGGLGGAAFAWYTMSRNPPGKEKTPVVEEHERELERLVVDSGLQDRLQEHFDGILRSQQIAHEQAIQAQTAWMTRALADRDRDRDLDRERISTLERKIGVHYDYHYLLRGRMIEAGLIPDEWPPDIDPRRSR